MIQQPMKRAAARRGVWTSIYPRLTPRRRILTAWGITKWWLQQQWWWWHWWQRVTIEPQQRWCKDRWSEQRQGEITSASLQLLLLIIPTINSTTLPNSHIFQHPILPPSSQWFSAFSSSPVSHPCFPSNTLSSCNIGSPKSPTPIFDEEYIRCSCDMRCFDFPTLYAYWQIALTVNSECFKGFDDVVPSPVTICNSTNFPPIARRVQSKRKSLCPLISFDETIFA